MPALYCGKVVWFLKAFLSLLPFSSATTSRKPPIVDLRMLDIIVETIVLRW